MYCVVVLLSRNTSFRAFPAPAYETYSRNAARIKDRVRQCWVVRISWYSAETFPLPPLHFENLLLGSEVSNLDHSGFQGQFDAAFLSLERAYANHETVLIYLNVDPRLKYLRSDPRFQDLSRRIGLPQ